VLKAAISVRAPINLRQVAFSSRPTTTDKIRYLERQ
jgi:hypothetical protein